MNATASLVVARLVCRRKGHDWIARPGGLKYQGCWTCDEVCSRCGGETWWPT